MAFQRTVDVLTFEVYNATILLVYLYKPELKERAELLFCYKTLWQQSQVHKSWHAIKGRKTIIERF